MNTPTTVILATLLAAGIAPALSAQRADSVRIRADIDTLAHDRWQGRGTCTRGIESAAEFIAKRFATLGLSPAGTPPTGSAPRDFFHRYTARPQAGMLPNGRISCAAVNVAGIVRGTDPQLANEYVVIGAHHDHLGRIPVGSRGTTGGTTSGLRGTAIASRGTPPGGEIHNGADDNASGTAAVLELARLFAHQPARRSVLFVTFSGEELGLLGSARFVENGMPAGRANAMLNFDMVGRMKNDRLLVFGVGTAKELRDVLNESNRGSYTLSLGFNPDGFGPSDHASFYAHSVPALHFFTDYHEQYHTPADDSNLINAAGEARVVDYAERVARSIADRDSALTFVAQSRRAAAPPTTGARPYLGSLPDMAASETPGLRLSGVTAGSPADRGGLKAGDIVVEFGGKPVTDLQTYSDALNAHKPGDSVRVVVLREGVRTTLSVTLGRRGE